MRNLAKAALQERGRHDSLGDWYLISDCIAQTDRKERVRRWPPFTSLLGVGRGQQLSKNYIRGIGEFSSKILLHQQLLLQGISFHYIQC